jgi:hypothetical protein
MQPSIRSIAAGLAAAVCLLPVAAAAQEAPTSNTAMTVTQVGGAFSAAGFQADQPIVWNWTSPAVTTIQVHDRAQGRLLMVLVYENDADAQLARQQARVREQLEGNQSAEASSPHLVPGYGVSAWRGNVALVETSQSQFDGMVRAQNDRDNAVYRDADVVQEPGPINRAVDFDFLQALDARADL